MSIGETMLARGRRRHAVAVACILVPCLAALAYVIAALRGAL